MSFLKLLRHESCHSLYFRRSLENFSESVGKSFPGRMNIGFVILMVDKKRLQPRFRSKLRIDSIMSSDWYLKGMPSNKYNCSFSIFCKKQQTFYFSRASIYSHVLRLVFKWQFKGFRIGVSGKTICSCRTCIVPRKKPWGQPCIFSFRRDPKIRMD